jgi:hypothetical protein
LHIVCVKGTKHKLQLHFKKNTSTYHHMEECSHNRLYKYLLCRLLPHMKEDSNTKPSKGCCEYCTIVTALLLIVDY